MQGTAKVIDYVAIEFNVNSLLKSTSIFILNSIINYALLVLGLYDILFSILHIFRLMEGFYLCELS